MGRGSVGVRPHKRVLEKDVARRKVCSGVDIAVLSGRGRM